MFDTIFCVCVSIVLQQWTFTPIIKPSVVSTECTFHPSIFYTSTHHDLLSQSQEATRLFGRVRQQSQSRHSNNTTNAIPQQGGLCGSYLSSRSLLHKEQASPQVIVVFFVIREVITSSSASHTRSIFSLLSSRRLDFAMPQSHQRHKDAPWTLLDQVIVVMKETRL